MHKREGIISSGKGHKYWSEFVPEIQSQIQSLAYEINEILFSPKLITPIKTAVEAVANRTWPQQSAVRIATAIEPARVATAGYEMEVEMEVDLEKVEQAQIQAAEKLKATGLHVSTATRVGDPKRFLIDETERWGADAIFIGARGHRFIERVLLGSVSYAIAARAHCSVEVVRSGR